MRFWCQLSKARFPAEICDEWIGDDEKMLVDDDKSSSVQPMSSDISSNVGKGPQQSSIVEEDERMLEEEADPSPPGNKITDGVVYARSSSSPSAKNDIEEKRLSALKICNIAEIAPLKPIVVVEDKKAEKEKED